MSSSGNNDASKSGEVLVVEDTEVVVVIVVVEVWMVLFSLWNMYNIFVHDGI